MTPMTRFASICLGLTMTVGLSACTSSGLSCSDPKTTETVIKMAKEDLVKKVGQDVATKTEMTLSGIKTTGDNGGRYECAAELDAKFPAETRIPEAKLPITYVSDNHGDSGHTVKVHGL
jgi:hypothetical protein